LHGLVPRGRIPTGRAILAVLGPDSRLTLRHDPFGPPRRSPRQKRQLAGTPFREV